MTTIVLLVVCIVLLIVPVLLISTLVPYTTLFRSCHRRQQRSVTHNQQVSDHIHHRQGRKQHRQRRGILTKIRECRVSTTSQRSEEHTSELQSRGQLVCRLLHEKKKLQPR